MPKSTRSRCEHVRKIALADLADEVPEGSWLETLVGLASASGTARSKTRGLEVYELSYPYGALIVERSQFRAPCGAASENCPACAEVIEAAAYSHIPLAAVVDGAAEVFLEEHRNDTAMSIPLRLLRVGDVFGVFESLEVDASRAKGREPQWHVSAGARSVHLLWSSREKPLLGTLARHIRREIGRSDEPFLREIADGRLRLQHRWNLMYARPWELVRCLAPLVAPDWKVRVILLPKEWVLSEDRTLTEFKLTLYRLGWQQSRLLRAEVASASSPLVRFPPTEYRGVGVDTVYLFQTAMHLLAIASGEAPALVPIGESPAGPFVEFQDYLKSIGLTKDRYPALVEPGHLTESTPIGYYSFRWPTLIGSVPDVRTPSALAVQVDRAIRQAIDETDTLDTKKTLYFGDGKGFSSENKGNLRRTKCLTEDEFAAEFVGDSGMKLQHSHSFFTGCARIARRNAR